MEHYRKLLIIPHIGTAYGHLIRTAEYVHQDKFFDFTEVHILIPQNHLDKATHFFPNSVKIHAYPLNFSVTNESGKIDIEVFKNILSYDQKKFEEIRPDFIIGDPGVRAGILGFNNSVPWAGMFHGCYLEIPDTVKKIREKEIKLLAEKAWLVSEKSLNEMTAVGTHFKLSSWYKLNSLGYNFIDKIKNKPVKEIWEEPSLKSKILFTVCSAGEHKIIPPLSLLEDVGEYFGEKIFVAGPSNQSLTSPKIDFVGEKFSYDSLISKNTLVICHGGWGTLNKVKGAKRIIAYPSDLDQLCNALLEYSLGNVELGIDLKYWQERVNSNTPYTREADWTGLKKYILK